MLATVSAARKQGRHVQSAEATVLLGLFSSGRRDLWLWEPELFGPSQRTCYPEGGQTGLSRGRAIPRDPTTTPAFWIWWTPWERQDQSHRERGNMCLFPRSCGLGDVTEVTLGLGLGYRCQPPKAQETREACPLPAGLQSLRRMLQERLCTLGLSTLPVATF